MKDPDRRVIRLIGFSLLGLVASSLAASPSRACSQPGPGIWARSTWPGSDRPVPTNARLVVEYRGEASQIGSDLVLLDAGGNPIDASVEVIDLIAIVRPMEPLLPEHGYQLADRRLVPCDNTVTSCALQATEVPFASFTTAATADSTAPVFAGVGGVVFSEDSCEGGGCCNIYKGVRADFSWSPASDDVAGVDVRYNLYRRSDGGRELVAALWDLTGIGGVLQCDGHLERPLRPGTYSVHAVDWAGNEDANTAERGVPDLCTGCGCANAGPAAGPGGLWWLVGLVGLLGWRRSVRVTGK